MKKKVELKYKLIREVTPKECSWLYRVFKKDEIVYQYYGPTYGCCKDNAYTLIPNTTPFFELPSNSVQEVIEI
jgi:hypothetical protein